MKSKFSIFLLLAAIFAGCVKDPVDNPDNPVNVVMQDVALSGIVKDASGNPLSGVNVTTGSLSATTGSDGTFSFTQAGTVDNRAIVQFEKSGYFTLTRSGDKEDEMYMEPMMYRKGNDSITLQTTFDASAAKTLQVGGVKIELPASCFANANGSAYSGTVHADVLNLGSGNANRAQMMPGGDLATDKSDEIVSLFGVMDVIFTDNAGNLLKIKDKTSIPISFLEPPGATDASVPIWTYDEAKGVWTEEGSATLQGNVYTGTVSHFCKKAVGKSSKYTILTVKVTKCDSSDPAVGARVTFNDNGMLQNLAYNFLFQTYITNSKGECKIKVDKDYKWDATIFVSYAAETKSVPLSNEDLTGETIVSFSFDNACDAGYPEKLAVKVYEGDVEYVSFDNFGLRTRYDTGEDLGFHLITIYDYVNFHQYEYSSLGTWIDQSIDSEGSTDWIDIRSPDCTSYPIQLLTERNILELKQYYTQQRDSAIAGITCKVYLSKGGGGINGTVAPAGYDRLFYWNRILMRNDNGGHGTLYYEIRAITKDVPASAFSKTLPHPWIQ